MDAVKFNALFIGTGAVIMLVAILTGLRLFRLLRQKNLRRIWTVQISLMVFFFGGYLLALRYVLVGTPDPILHLVAVIFAFGAMFVLLTVNISVSLASRLMTLNEQLEHKVEDRTKKLSDAYDKLTLNMETLKKTQCQLLQSAKMASVGALAAGVAHELNNPLAIIAGYTELMAADAGAQADDRFARIKASIERMRAIISHLRVFSRDSSGDDRIQIDIRRPISNAIAFTRHELVSAGIEVSHDFTHGDHLIEGNAVQLESVFQNLILNSRDAFRQVPNTDKKVIVITTTAENGYLRISYEDNATGVPKDVLEHMFEPFYTTKETGQGTGLGLAIAQEIVDQHHGRISAKNKARGLSFCIDIPVSSRGPESLPSDPRDFAGEPATQKAEHKPRILVIDDEVSMCHLIHAFLADDFQVNATSDPELGMDLIENQNFDMILTDLRMPHISGVEIIRKAKTLQPATPVIAITGFPSESPLVTKAVESGADAVVTKPFAGREGFRSVVLNELHPPPS